MKKILIYILFVVLSVNLIYALDLSDYPKPFIKYNLFNDIVVVIGSGNPQINSLVATDIVLGLPTNKGTSTTLVDYENVDLNKNLIVIGTPCDNKITALLLGTDDCKAGLKEGEALIKLIPKNENAALVVTAYSANDLRKAGQILRNYEDYYSDFKGTSLLIKNGVISQYSGTAVTSTPTTEETPFSIGGCDGCVYEKLCLKPKTRVFNQYCSDDKTILDQKKEGEFCNDNYECMYNKCSDNKCIGLTIWQRFVLWFKSIFTK